MISLKIETKTNDYKSAVVLIEEALSQIRNGSLAGIIGGNMGECMFSIDEIAAQQTLIPDVEACTAKQYHDDFAEGGHKFCCWCGERLHASKANRWT